MPSPFPRRAPRRLPASTPFACLALLLAACDDPGRIRTGPELFRMQGCVTCHGMDAHGTNMAPDLRGKAQHWTREKLVEYLKNPPEYIRKDDRLREQKKSYSLNMPLYGILRVEELQNLADHVLAKAQEPVTQ